jgi:hypothetical protein
MAEGRVQVLLAGYGDLVEGLPGGRVDRVSRRGGWHKLAVDDVAGVRLPLTIPC